MHSLIRFNDRILFFWKKYRKFRIVIFPEMGPCPHLLTLWKIGYCEDEGTLSVNNSAEDQCEICWPGYKLNGTVCERDEGVPLVNLGNAGFHTNHGLTIVVINVLLAAII